MPRRSRHKPAKQPLRRNVGSEVRASLEAALDGALTAYLRLFGLPALPAEGFDAALRADWPYRAARTEFNAALESLLSTCPVSVKKRHELAVEERVNDLAIAAATVGWKLGVTGCRED